MKNIVFVSGSFDLLHTGHIEFLENASNYGDLYVGIGSDETVKQLKGDYPVMNENERKYMVESLKFVSKCKINSGNGIIDFLNEISTIKPEIFIVNQDGDHKEKFNLCKKLNIEYKVFERKPKAFFKKRSTTKINKISRIPYRIDIAGGWLDQLSINNLCSGSVITISIEPNKKFNQKSGMATSTRKAAKELWGNQLPIGNKEKLAKILFSYDNFPVKKEISGSQDAIGIVYPGVNKLFYENGYWPKKIDTVLKEKTLNFIEKNIYLVPLGPRKDNYDVYKNSNINNANCSKLSKASEKTWRGIINNNLKDFGEGMLEAFQAQLELFPNMIDNEIIKNIEKYKKNSLGYKLSGAGGGGYIIIVSKTQVKDSFKIKIRRKNNF